MAECGLLEAYGLFAFLGGGAGVIVFKSSKCILFAEYTFAAFIILMTLVEHC